MTRWPVTGDRGPVTLPPSPPSREAPPGRRGGALPPAHAEDTGISQYANKESDVLQSFNMFVLLNLLTSAISQFVFKSSNLISSFLIFYTLYPPLFLFYPFLTIQDLHILFLNQKIFPSPVFFFYNLSCWREDEVV